MIRPSWFSRLALAGLFLGLGLSCASVAPVAPHKITNLRLSPDYSHWLVGALARMASKDETKEFLALGSDAEAADFVERFWETRDPDTARPGNPLRDLYEARTKEADDRFSQAGYVGRRTDRGTIFVLYGEPTRVDHGVASKRGGAAPEIWEYEDATMGLDGRIPAAFYRFEQRGDLMVFERQAEPVPGLRNSTVRDF